jgi:hypothetical protein
MLRAFLFALDQQHTLARRVFAAQSTGAAELSERWGVASWRIGTAWRMKFPSRAGGAGFALLLLRCRFSDSIPR